MADITCFVGRLRSTIQFDFPFELAGLSIPDYYKIGSSNTAGHAAIKMKIDQSRFDDSIISSGQPTSAMALHTALDSLTLNGLKGPVDRIGLLLADRFVAGTLGLMFDTGFAPVSDFFNSVPREGCAIFLNEIAAIRPNADDFVKEVVFTAVHEIGHIFNLPHSESRPNFMATSPVSAPFDSDAYEFEATHRNFLMRANIDKHVMPGGSDFEDTGGFGPPANNPFNPRLEQNDLQLEISVSQDQFWFFEPIELDVQIKSKFGSYAVRNEVDPGYDSFVIHITKPNGTTFKYRSPRIYCRNFLKLVISPDAPFVRDVSIFGQSGGYTFQQPGDYTIRCAFDTGLGFQLISNTISVNVCVPEVRKASFQKIEKVLTSKKPALLLYHRSGNFGNAAAATLEELSRYKKGTTLSTNIQYALVKYKTHKSGKPNRDQLKVIDRLTNQALDSGRLSKARTKNLARIKDVYGI